MQEIKTGIIGKAVTDVSTEQLASSMGSGSLDVFATPAMITLMEKAACNCIEKYLEDDETTVGIAINVNHIDATPKGVRVTVEATLTNIDGREFTFEVKAEDEYSTIGIGSHKRFLVYGNKFTEKTYKKLNK